MELNKGTLYLVPTPIGNLLDMTYRAVEVLRAVDLIGAEDTRHSAQLLRHFSIDTELISYHEHNKESRGPELIRLLQEGKTIALISDAGMPAISDPGADLVRLAIEANVRIEPLPGANAGLTALIASGLDTTEFIFLGFLPKRSLHRIETLERVKRYTGTLIFYEAPHRLDEVLQDIYTVLGNRRITVGRELTKKFETFTYTTLKELRENSNLLTVRGEFVLIVEGAKEFNGSVEEQSKESLTPTDYVELVWKKVDEGMNKKEAIREIAKLYHLSRRDLYNEVELRSKEA